MTALEDLCKKGVFVVRELETQLKARPRMPRRAIRSAHQSIHLSWIGRIKACFDRYHVMRRAFN
jgi:hypothetical protein